MITSLFDLDRTVREATRRLARARASLSERLPPGEPVPSPLAPFRSVLSKATYDELADLPDPLLAPALRSHLARLILARVLWDDEVRLARAWTDPSVTLGDHTPLPPLPRAVSRTADGTSFPPKLLLQALLVDPNPDRRARIAEAFTRAARDHLRDPARRHADRRAAASHQLGVPLDALDLPHHPRPRPRARPGPRSRGARPRVGCGRAGDGARTEGTGVGGFGARRGGCGSARRRRRSA
ncbi:MAG: hypothetical protein R3B70_04890 [Polyangiaceae bacterium]